VCKISLCVLVFCKCPDGSSSSLQRAIILFKFKALRGKFTTLKIEKSIVTKMKKHKLRREREHKERTKHPKARQQHPKAKGR
jgi:hypothetical protein